MVFLHLKFQTQSLRLSDLHRKAQLWRGIVSVTLIEGRELKAMDPNGLSDPYVKFRLAHQKYKSKVSLWIAFPMVLMDFSVLLHSICMFNGIFTEKTLLILQITKLFFEQS